MVNRNAEGGSKTLFDIPGVYRLVYGAPYERHGFVRALNNYKGFRMYSTLQKLFLAKSKRYASALVYTFLNLSTE